jgi:hypothetical protein
MLMFLGCIQPSLEFIVTDENNYSFSSTLSAQSTEIQEAQDGVIDWSNLSTGLLGNSIEPSMIDGLSIIRFPRLSQAEVLIGINNETLKQSDLSGLVEFTPNGDLNAQISDFSLQGTPVQPEVDLLSAQGTFLVLANIQDEIASLLFFAPVTSSDNHSIYIYDDSVTLDYDVSLSGTSIAVQQAAEYYIDWSQLSTTGTGNPIALEQIDRLMLGGFSQSPQELQQDFLQLEQLADEFYSVDVTGITALPFDRISGFNGFEPSLQWIVALQCSRCLNPAPLFVGVFDEMDH